MSSESAAKVWTRRIKSGDSTGNFERDSIARARMLMDATIFKDTLVMSYKWPADRQSLSWTLESSSLLKALEGSYRLTPKGSGTDVTYELSVDLAIPMIGMLKRKAERRLIDGALKDLKKRVEAE